MIEKSKVAIPTIVFGQKRYQHLKTSRGCLQNSDKYDFFTSCSRKVRKIRKLKVMARQKELYEKIVPLVFPGGVIGLGPNSQQENLYRRLIRETTSDPEFSLRGHKGWKGTLIGPDGNILYITLWSFFKLLINGWIRLGGEGWGWENITFHRFGNVVEAGTFAA